MKTYPRLFAKLFCEPVLVTEPVRFALESALLGRMGIHHTGERADDLKFKAADEPQRSYGEHGRPMDDYLQFNRDVKATREVMRIENVYRRYGRVAVVTLDGIIDKHLTEFEMSCYGGYDLVDFDHALQVAGRDPRVEAVVLAINSPGGSAIGVPESAARVAELAKTKEVHAFVDAQACSAAYYIASQADHLAVAPSAVVGSIGVYIAVLDESRALEMEGYRVEFIKAGKFKGMGASFKPLTGEEHAMLQARVDGLHADFRAAVRDGRRRPTENLGFASVKDDAMEGQTFVGKDALAARLADELTNANLDEYVASLV